MTVHTVSTDGELAIHVKQDMDKQRWSRDVFDEQGVIKALMSLQVYQGPSGVEALHQAASQIAALRMVQTLLEVNSCPGPTSDLHPCRLWEPLCRRVLNLI